MAKQISLAIIHKKTRMISIQAVAHNYPGGNQIKFKDWQMAVAGRIR